MAFLFGAFFEAGVTVSIRPIFAAWEAAIGLASGFASLMPADLLYVYTREPSEPKTLCLSESMKQSG